MNERIVLAIGSWILASIVHVLSFFSILFATIAAYILLRPPHFPNIPGPPLSAYFPGGDAFAIAIDSSKFMGNLLKFSKQYEEFYRVWIGPKEVLVTYEPADIVHVLTNRSDFERTKSAHTILDLAMPGSLFTLPRDGHLVARRGLRHHFNHSILKGFHIPIHEAIDELKKDLSKAIVEGNEGQSNILDMNKVLSTVTFRVILNVSFGAELSLAKREKFSDDMDNMTEDLLREVLGYGYRRFFVPFGIRNRFFSHKKEIDDTIEGIIEKRLSETEEEKKNRRPDLLDSILDIEPENKVRMISHGVLFSIAGSHTSNVAMSWCLFYVSQDQRIEELILQELETVAPNPDEQLKFEDLGKLKYLTKVWKEALRMNPPAAIIAREAVRNVTLKGSGISVPKGSAVFAFHGASQLSSRHWDEPHKFIPERWGTAENPGEGEKVKPGVYSPFSLGIRNCVGQILAEYEGLIILGELFRRFKFSLACKPERVVSRSAWVQSGRYSSKNNGVFDMGIPMYVRRRFGDENSR